ncbi:hypothetical protein [[Limnothrix rosea] IAM M-220]|uniref:hypothetical protein n=1 Tax=[Limnothrix rosea] IAM M-220 TaxID=454133 RepID=UPI0015C57970|nr:hypothetical protein [[Limnothrix rosea] IAM M-220]
MVQSYLSGQFARGKMGDLIKEITNVASQIKPIDLWALLLFSHGLVGIFGGNGRGNYLG